MTNSSQFLEFSINIAKAAGSIQMKYFGNISSIKKKSTNIDLVTEADLESEDYLIKAIKKTYPNHSILSEENGSIVTDSEYQWVIDPLDGTTNFAHKIPIFAVSIGLKKNNIIICAVVFNPAADKCFYAGLNKGAFLNGNKIQCTSSNTLSNSLIVTGFPYIHDLKYDTLFILFKEFYDKTRGVRRLGAASLDLCFVAMGRFDAYYEFGLNEWDLCAGRLIVNEAGGTTSDWNNKNTPNTGKRILATNGIMHNQMVEILTKKDYLIFF